jgi:glutathione S-transferase
MSELKVYGYLPSQPMRSVLAYLKLSSIEYTQVTIVPIKGEHLSEDYKKINPFQAIPSIVHGDYNLWESVAIVTYLSEVYDVENSWYPKDLKIRGRINAYLHWHHQGIREPCMDYLNAKIIGPKYLGLPEITEEQEEKLRIRLNQMLDDLKWTLSETRYAARTFNPTMADIFTFNELTLVVARKFFRLEDHPEVKSWYLEIGAIPVVKELTYQCFEYLLSRA